MNELSPIAVARPMRVVSDAPALDRPHAHRFDAALERIREELVKASPADQRLAERTLTLASAAAHQERDFVAWEHLHAVDRLLLGTLDAPARRRKAIAQLAEARDKLTDWRLRAVEEVFADYTCSSPQFFHPPDVETLRFVQELIHGRSQNREYKLLLVRRQLQIATLLLLGALGALLFAILTQVELFLTGTFLGLAGAAMSMVLTLRKPDVRPIPALRGSLELGLLRPLLGAISGLVMSLMMMEGSTAQAIAPLFAASCFLSGFSERFFLTRIEEAVGEK